MEYNQGGLHRFARAAALARSVTTVALSLAAFGQSFAQQSEVRRELQIITAPEPLNGDRAHNHYFGLSVATTSDWLLITDPSAGDGNGGRGGELYTYRRTAQGWELSDRHFTQPLNSLEDIAIDGNTLVSGNYHFGWPPSILGKVHIFEREGGQWVKKQELYPDGLDPSEHPSFGLSVAISGDVLVTSAPGMDQPVWGGGELRVYERTAGLWQLVSRFRLSPTPEVLNADYFYLGMDTQVQENLIVAGASGNQGAVYIYEKLHGEWQHTEILPNPSPLNGDHFGRSLALKGNLLIVGQPATDVSRRGAAFVYERDANRSWVLRRELRASDGYANSDSGDQFGSKVVIDNDERIIISAPRGQYNGPSTGTVYVFEKADGIWPETETYRLVASDSQGQSDWVGSSLAVQDGFVISGAIGALHEGVREGKTYAFPLHAGSTYCTEQAGASLVVAGSDVLANQSLTVATSSAPPFTRVLSFAAPSRGSFSFGRSTLCLGAPAVRLGPIQAGAEGIAVYPVDLTHPRLSSIFLPGTSWYFQNAMEGVPGSGRFELTSNAVWMTMR